MVGYNTSVRGLLIKVTTNHKLSHIVYCIVYDRVIAELEPVVSKHLFHFSYYNFLWKDDLHGNFSEFTSQDPGMFAIKKEVER